MNIILENTLLKAIFDKKTGAFISFENKNTGWKIQGRESLALSFRMTVPTPYRNNNLIRGEMQILSHYEISPDGNQVIFVWERLQTEHGDKVDITFKGIVGINEAGLYFKAEVTNDSYFVIEDINYPCIGDLRTPQAGHDFSRMNLAYAGMQKASLYPKFMTERGYWGTDHPIQIVSDPFNSFVLAGNDKEGLYLGYHETTIKQLVEYVFELKPGNESTLTFAAPYGEDIAGKSVNIECRIVHFPFIQPGETGGISTIVLKPYEGTWHKGADYYKEWRKTWFKRASTPEWASEVNSWQQLQINSSADELRCRYSDLVKYGHDCVKHGVDAIQLVGWTIKGQDGRTPSHDIDQRLGTWDELKDAISEIQAMGIKIVLYTKFTFAETATEWFKNELYKYASKDCNGEIHSFPGYNYMTPAQLANINTHRLAVMCFNSPEWRKVSCSEFEKCIDLGADGMLFDESCHHANMRYCYDGSHGHHIPAFNAAGDELLDKEFREITDKRAPAFLFAGEALYDLQNERYSVSYVRVYDLDHIGLQRYVDPYSQIMIGVAGYDDRETINICLMFRYIVSYEPLHFKGSLDDFPMTVEYGKKVDALRKQYSEYLWHAEYRDVLEARVVVNGEVYRRYTVFKQHSSDKKAVVIANHDKNNDILAQVFFEGKNYSLAVVSPEAPQAVKTNGTVTIPPRSVAVIIQEPNLY